MNTHTQFRAGIHPYAPDGVPDLHGQDRCERCGLARGHRWHKLPATDAAVTEQEARRAGELPAGQDQAEQALAAFDAAQQQRDESETV